MKNDLTLIRIHGFILMAETGIQPLAIISIGKAAMMATSVGITEMVDTIVGTTADGFSIIHESRINMVKLMKFGKSEH